MKKILCVMFVLLVSCTAVYASSPSVWYSMDDDGNVYREEASGRVKADVEVGRVDGSVFQWMEADNAVWIFNPYELDIAPIHLQIRDGENCKQVMQSYDGSLYILYLSSQTIAAYDMGGGHVIRTPGMFPAYRVDDYRFTFTSLTGGRRGVSVFEVFPEEENGPEVLVTTVIRPTRTVEYTADGIDDDGECLVIKHKGRETERMRVALPAAG